MSMTIEQLATEIGAPNKDALQAKLDEYGYTVPDCENNQQYRNDLIAEFADHSSGLAVVGSGSVAQVKVPEPAPEPIVQKKKGRMTKTQKLEQEQARAEENAARIETLVTTVTDRQIEQTRLQVGAIDDLQDGLATYLTGKVLGMDSAIAEQVSANIKEAGDSCNVGMAQLMRGAVSKALAGLELA